MNKHQDYRDLLPYYVSGTLDAEQRAAVEAHLHTCEQCRRDVEFWQRLKGGLELAHPLPSSAALPTLPDPHRASLSRKARRPWFADSASSRTSITRAILGAISVVGAVTVALWGAMFLILWHNGTTKQWSKPSNAQHPTQAVQVSYRGNWWVVHTAIGNLASPKLINDSETAVQRFSTFEELQAAASFPFRRPRHLPEGYFFREGLLAPSRRAVLIYEGPQGSIVLLQVPITHTTNLSEKPAVLPAFELFTEQPIQEAIVNGHEAIWLGDDHLIWEDDGIHFILGGSGLTPELAQRIAESLR